MNASSTKNGYVISLDAWGKYLTIAEGEPNSSNPTKHRVELAYGVNKFEVNAGVSWTEVTSSSGQITIKDLSLR